MARLTPTLIALALVGASVAAFAVTEHLKLGRSPVTAPRFTRHFSPVCGCATDRAKLVLRFRRADVVDAEIVDANGEAVRVLAQGRAVEAGDVTFVWDGRDASGRVAPDGPYRLRLRLDRDGRTLLVPTTSRIDTRPPRILGLEHRPDVISPDGDGRADRLRIAYRSNERAAARLLVDGEQAVRTLLRPPRRTHRLQWLGTVPVQGGGGEPAAAGEYEVTLVLVDQAGNETRAAFPVTVRYVELDESSYRAAPGGAFTFRVDTDAVQVSWSLSRRTRQGLEPPILSGEGPGGQPVSAKIPPGSRPGRYVLLVEAQGHADRAAVFVEGAG